MPYVRTDNDVYGTYELNFAAYSKICTVNLPAPTTTTTTTVAPTTTTTVAPTTTTTTTTAPSAVGYLVSGAGDTSVNGTYCEAGTINGRPYYTYSSLYLYWYPSLSQEQGRWHIGTVNGSEEGSVFYATRDDGDENIMPDDIFTNWYNGSDSWWGFETGTSPSPTVTQTTCGTTTTTTAEPTTTTTTAAPTTTTTTTTTSAPAGAFTLSGAGISAVNGCYNDAGIYNDKPYYSNGSYFVWYEGIEFAWFISQSVGGGPPDYYGSNENDVPSIWDWAAEPSAPPTLSQGCGGGYSSSFNFNIDFVP
jgi:hypothetical protein